MAIAELLRHARERRGVTLEKLAEETRIPRARLASFEQEGFRPAGGFYQRAQIRACAQALGLDEQLVLRELNDAATAAPAASPGAPQPTVRRAGGLSVALAIGGIVAVVLAVSAALTRETSPTVPTESTAAPAISSPSEPPVDRVRNEQSVQIGEPASRATVGTTEPEDAPPASEVREVTELVITSQPEGARVTVDGVGWGVTPLTIRHLPPGRKRVRVTTDGYAAVERVVDVPSDRVSSVSVELLPTPTTPAAGY